MRTISETFATVPKPEKLRSCAGEIWSVVTHSKKSAFFGRTITCMRGSLADHRQLSDALQEKLSEHKGVDKQFMKEREAIESSQDASNRRLRKESHRKLRVLG